MSFVGSPRYTEMVKRAMARPVEEGSIVERILMQFCEEQSARLAGIEERVFGAETAARAA